MVACPERGRAWRAEADQGLRGGPLDWVPGGPLHQVPGLVPCIQSDRGDFQMNISMVLRWYQHHERTVNFCSGPYLETGVMEALCGGTFKHRIVFSTRGSLQKCVS